MSLRPSPGFYSPSAGLDPSTSEPTPQGGLRHKLTGRGSLPLWATPFIEGRLSAEPWEDFV